jgi:Tfp pilus assembly protein PilZ
MDTGIPLDSNKRSYTRFKKILKVKIESSGIYSWGVVNDISLTGLFIKTNRKLKEGTRITIDLNLPNGEQIHLKGLIKRNRDLAGENWIFGIGVKLLKNDEHYQKFVHEFIEQAKRANEEFIDSTGSNEYFENKAMRETP